MKSLAILALVLVLTGCAFGMIEKPDRTVVRCVVVGHAECKSCDGKDNCDTIRGGYGSIGLWEFLSGLAAGTALIFTGS